MIIKYENSAVYKYEGNMNVLYELYLASYKH